MKIVAFVPDLMDKSRFHPVPGEKVFVRSASDLSQAEAGDIVVADLSRPGSLDALAALPNERRIAFVSHVDDEAIQKAKKQGIEVMPRSKFFSRIVEHLTI